MKQSDSDFWRLKMELWQEQLGLGDWRINLILEPELEAQGRVFWDIKLIDATIKLRPVVEARDDGYNPAIDSNRDPLEKTLIHELLHLHFVKLGQIVPNWLETVVDKLAWAYYLEANDD